MCQGDNNMKFTVSQLRRIIKEEVSRLLESSEAPKQDKSPKKTKDSKHSKIKKLVDELKELLETENLDENYDDEPLIDQAEYAASQSRAAAQWDSSRTKTASEKELARQRDAEDQRDRYRHGTSTEQEHGKSWYGT